MPAIVDGLIKSVPNETALLAALRSRISAAVFCEVFQRHFIGPSSDIPDAAAASRAMFQRTPIRVPQAGSEFDAFDLAERVYNYLTRSPVGRAGHDEDCTAAIAFTILLHSFVADIPSRGVQSLAAAALIERLWRIDDELLFAAARFFAWLELNSVERPFPSAFRLAFVVCLASCLQSALSGLTLALRADTEGALTAREKADCGVRLFDRVVGETYEHGAWWRCVFDKALLHREYGLQRRLLEIRAELERGVTDASG